MLLNKLLVIVTVIGVCQLPSLALAGMKRYDGYKVLSAIPGDDIALSALRNLMTSDSNIDFWREPSSVGTEVHMMISPQHLDRIEDSLREAGIMYKTHLHNVQETMSDLWRDIHRYRRSQQEYKHHGFVIDSYNSLDDIYRWMHAMVGKCPSHGLKCEVYSVGKSYEGRPINIFKISKNGENRKAYWLDATIHAREWLATATIAKILNHLVTGGDADAQALTDTYDWYIMPVMNPDGYAYTWSDDRMWRKNRRPNNGSDCVGTDLNRNFDFRWGNDGVSFDPCSEIFCGPSAGSEPETVAVAAELRRLGPTLAAMVTIHSYSQMWIFPWGNTVNYTGEVCDLADDTDDMMIVANAAIAAIQATYNTQWWPGNSCVVSYATTGGSDDYSKGAAGIKYPVCLELRGDTFFPTVNNIDLSFNEIWNGIVAMCRTIKSLDA